jgi:hypothetical protein
VGQQLLALQLGRLKDSGQMTPATIHQLTIGRELTGVNAF